MDLRLRRERKSLAHAPRPRRRSAAALRVGDVDIEVSSPTDRSAIERSFAWERFLSPKVEAERPILEAFLTAHGIPPHGPLGVRLPLRLREELLPVGERIHVIGVPERAENGGWRFVPPAGAPLVVASGDQSLRNNVVLSILFEIAIAGVIGAGGLWLVLGALR